MTKNHKFLLVLTFSLLIAFSPWIIATMIQCSVVPNVVRYQKWVSNLMAVNVSGDINLAGGMNEQVVNWGGGINDVALPMQSAINLVSWIE